MRIAFSSDWHIDINEDFFKKKEIVNKIIEFINNNNIDILSFAGDISGNMDKTIDILKKVQQETNVIIKAVTGNHDVFTENDTSTSWDKYMQFSNEDFSLINNPYIINDEWVMIGDMGWYDYSCGTDEFSFEEYDKMICGRVSWQDLYECNWNGNSNIEISNYMLENISKQLEHFKDKNIIMVTHIVPFSECVLHKEGDLNWNYLSAFIGCKRLGELFKNYNVKISHFGHTHQRYHTKINDMQIICSPLGYKNEWKQPKRLKKELERVMTIVEI